MDWTERQQRREALIDWGAPALLAGALGWSAYAVTGATVVAALAAVAALGLGLATMRGLADGSKPSVAEFAPEPFEAADGELLLDDPLTEVAPDSRVALLFDSGEQSPGAMVARISDYLVERGQLPQPVPERDAGNGGADAGAALHAALANIRASLR